MTRIDRLADRGLDLGGLDTTLGFLLHAAWRDVARSFADAFKGAGISPVEYSVLLLAGRNPGCAIGDLSEIMGITPNNMARLIDGLLEKGAVERKVGNKDKRVRTISLSAAGQDMLARLSDRHHAHEQDLNRRLGAARIGQLCALLREFD